MPAFVRTDKCDGCHDQPQPACVHICPHDLMRLAHEGIATGHMPKAFNQEPDQCWDCYACIKHCPQNAIETRPYADVAPLGAAIRPLRGTGSVIWTVTFRNGNLKRFKFPIRNTPEGSIDPYDGKPDADIDRIADPGFFVESKGFRAGDPAQLIAK